MQIEIRLKISGVPKPIIHSYFYQQYNLDEIIKKINNTLSATFITLEINKSNININWLFTVRDSNNILTKYEMEKVYANWEDFLETLLRFITVSELLEEGPPKNAETFMEELKDFIKTLTPLNWGIFSRTRSL